MVVAESLFTTKTHKICSLINYFTENIIYTQKLALFAKYDA